MAWKNGYYYRNRRRGRKVQSEYVGAGALGEMAAQLDEHAREQKQLQRLLAQTEQAAENDIDRPLDEIGVQVQALVTATLLASGYHMHKRQWRKQRGDSS